MFPWCKSNNKIHMIFLCLYLYSFSPLSLNMYWCISNIARCWCSVYRDSCLVCISHDTKPVTRFTWYFCLYFYSYHPLSLCMYWCRSNRARCCRSVYRDSCLACRMYQKFVCCKANNKIHMICLCLYFYSYYPLSLCMHWWRSNSARYWRSSYRDWGVLKRAAQRLCRHRFTCLRHILF
jgi:hypothetical protein